MEFVDAVSDRPSFYFHLFLISVFIFPLQRKKTRFSPASLNIDLERGREGGAANIPHLASSLLLVEEGNRLACMSREGEGNLTAKAVALPSLVSF